MTAILPLILSVLFGAFLFASRERFPRSDASAKPSNVKPSNPEPARPLSTLVRRGKIGNAPLSEQVRSTARIAPADSPETLLEVFSPDGALLARIATSEVAMVRAWSRGRLVAVRGEARPQYGSAWPLNPTAEGWEIHLVTASGSIYRCAGDTTSSVLGDLARLHRRINESVLALAS
jgi:hypothetical protein